MNFPRLAVVTPAKNEIENLPRLVACVEASTLPIDLWIVVDDNSTDGTGEYLDACARTIKGARKLLVLHRKDLPPEYALGPKYAMVVDAALNELRAYEERHGIQFPFIGLLDADMFPDPAFYENLLKKFDHLPRLGIASGVLFHERDGKRRPDRLQARWVRGNLRVWRAECLRDAPYVVCTSADAVSAARAWTAGWHCQAFPDSVAVTRDYGVRSDPKYYGGSAYKLHMPYHYFFMKFLWMCCRDGRAFAWAFFQGYHEARKDAKRVSLPPEVSRYFHQLLWRNMVENRIASRNMRTLRKLGAI
jgi:glycosyltransferase involved in cell wall biosynthesis